MAAPQEEDANMQEPVEAPGADDTPQETLEDAAAADERSVEEPAIDRPADVAVDEAVPAEDGRHAQEDTAGSQKDSVAAEDDYPEGDLEDDEVEPSAPGGNEAAIPPVVSDQQDPTAQTAAAAEPAKLDDLDDFDDDDEAKEIADEARADGEGQVAEDEDMAAQDEVKEDSREAAKELEGDAAEDSRPRLSSNVEIASQTTLNVVETCDGNVLMALADTGFQHLTGCARCNVGIKSGRYLFEVRVVESKIIYDMNKARVRPMFTLGFSTAGSSLFLGEGSEGIGISSNGALVQENWSSTPLFTRCLGYSSNSSGHPSWFGLLLNLDQSSPNANTISFFWDGIRMCDPQPLPEGLRGKTLHPTVNFRGLSLRFNFGADCQASMPFVCRMLQDASEDDVVCIAEEEPKESRGEKREVIFPMGLPNQGVYQWADEFQKSHRSHVELSPRFLKNWALQSGLHPGHGHGGSNDRPELDFGVREIDDYSMLSLMQSRSSLFQRDFVVLQLENNMIKEERARLLSNFSAHDFKRVAVVAMGEPPADFQHPTRRQLASSESKEGDEKTPEGETAEDAAGDASANDQGNDKSDKLATNKLEAASWFMKGDTDDICKRDLSRSFHRFSLPDDSEGFDEIRYVWQPADVCSEHFKSWMCQRKLTERIDNLHPGNWFKAQLAAWEQAVQGWKRLKTKHQDAKADRRKADASKDKEGENKENDKEAEAAELQSAVAIDPMLVEDVLDAGDGQTLFASFTWEDWTMLSTRYELHLLLHAFKVDVNDQERLSFQMDHLPFYYSMYYRCNLNVKDFGVATLAELMELVKDTVEVQPGTSLLEAQLAEDTPLENFIRLTEDHRRERQRRYDSGDRTAKLNLTRPQSGSSDTRQYSHNTHSDRGNNFHRNDYHRNDRGGQQWHAEKNKQQSSYYSRNTSYSSHNSGHGQRDGTASQGSRLTSTNYNARTVPPRVLTSGDKHRSTPPPPNYNSSRSRDQHTSSRTGGTYNSQSYQSYSSHKRPYEDSRTYSSTGYNSNKRSNTGYSYNSGGDNRPPVRTSR